jgi:hypothetical protein
MPAWTRELEADQFAEGEKGAEPNASRPVANALCSAQWGAFFGHNAAGIRMAGKGTIAN